MTQLVDYFVLEAGEFLEQLDRALGAAIVDLAHAARLARGIRGSAQLAAQGPIARVAAALERALCAAQQGRLPWNEETRGRAVRTVDDLKVLLRAVRQWDAAADERARAAFARWDGVADSAGPKPEPVRTELLFSFFREEVAGILAELDFALGELRKAPTAHAPLRHVLRRMRAVRGVRGAEPFAPLLQVLEALEDAAQEIVAEALPVDRPWLTRLEAMRDVLEESLLALGRGRLPDPDGPAWQRYRELSEDTTEVDDAVPIGTLVPEDGLAVAASPVAPVPSGDRVDPAVLEFVRIEGTALLDRAEAALREAQGDGDARRRALPRARSLVAAVADLARVYGLRDLAQRAATASAVPDLGPAQIAEVRQALPGAAIPTEEDAVPIETLLLRGPRALEEILRLRPDLERLLDEHQAAEPLRAAVRELFALVELARTA